MPDLIAIGEVGENRLVQETVAVGEEADPHVLPLWSAVVRRKYYPVGGTIDFNQTFQVYRFLDD
jgi:hypothetical protein